MTRNVISEAVIVEAVRTPVGRRNGALSEMHPADLAAEALSAVAERAGIDPAVINDVVMGCVLQVGDQSLNIARNAVLGAGYPESVPAVTIDRQCGSSQQAVHFAAQSIMSRTHDVVVAAGVESMSRVPMFSNTGGPGRPYGPLMRERYGFDEDVINQGVSADKIARDRGFDRIRLDEIATESHRRAEQAREEGRFDREIAPVGDLKSDEGIRPGTSIDTLAKLNPAFAEDGLHTAGNSSQISDAAAAIMLMSPERAEELGLRPRARIVELALAADDPILMLTAPWPATFKALEQAELTIDDIDLFEVNEAFAAVLGAWLAETGADYSKVNVNGGAISLGHPLGASGVRLMVTLLHELERTGGRYGLQTMCEGGGMANATIIERL